MSNTGDIIDNRPKAAVYSTARSKRDKRAIELLNVFCAVSGLRPTFYLDKQLPKEGQPPGWQRLLEDVAKGQYDVVLTWLSAPGMQEYCTEHNTRFEEVDPFVFSQAIRASSHPF